MGCVYFNDLMLWQHDMLMSHISKNKYYLGQKGIYVNFHEAEMDFVMNYLTDVAHDLRLDFCYNHCPAKDCPLRDAFIKRDGT